MGTHTQQNIPPREKGREFGHTDGPGRHCTKWNELVTSRQVPYDLAYRRLPELTVSQDGKQVLGLPGIGEGKRAPSLLREGEKVLGTGVGDGSTV